MNYAFLGLWLLAAWTWRHWAWRAFVLMMIVNGAIIFARPAARPLGVLLVAALLWAWAPAYRRQDHLAKSVKADRHTVVVTAR